MLVNKVIMENFLKQTKVVKKYKKKILCVIINQNMPLFNNARVWTGRKTKIYSFRDGGFELHRSCDLRVNQWLGHCLIKEMALSVCRSFTSLLAELCTNNS